MSLGKSLVPVCFAVSMVIAACSTRTIGKTEVKMTSTPEDKTKSIDENHESEPESDVLPPEPRKVLFQSLDGIELQGVYYPSADSNAPLIILMHWAQGDQNDWTEIACWLQNRNLLGSSENRKNSPYLDSSWFPQMDLGRSFAVFTFTFRDCQGGCKSFERENWLLDAEAAADFGRTLGDIDEDQIIFIGASIGADGAVDACLYLNTQFPGACKGALSLSPGNYLTRSYQAVVNELANFTSPVFVWCLYSEDDKEAYKVCNGFDADYFKGVLYPSGSVQGYPHGMGLIKQDVNPNPLKVMLQFLGEVS